MIKKAKGILGKCHYKTISKINSTSMKPLSKEITNRHLLLDELCPHCQNYTNCKLTCHNG